MDSSNRRRRSHNSLRYPGRDYSLPGKYFITICTANRKEWFGTTGSLHATTILLSDIGNIAYKLWYEIPQHFSYITLDAFVIMPNHIHGIIFINKNSNKNVVGSLHATTLPSQDNDPVKNTTKSLISPKSGSLSVVIRSYKSAVTRYARMVDSDFSWQSGFYDSIICTARQLARVRKYIENNLLKWMYPLHV